MGRSDGIAMSHADRIAALLDLTDTARDCWESDIARVTLIGLMAQLGKIDSAELDRRIADLVSVVENLPAPLECECGEPADPDCNGICRDCAELEFDRYG